ncbi:MAG: DUF1344 domain-containing protein [Paracoccaceae bacterium]
MRNKLASVVLLTATLGFGAVAMATPTETLGTIKSINAKTLSVTLMDGSVYKVAKSIKLADFKAGEKVKVEWEMKGKSKDATLMTAAS